MNRLVASCCVASCWVIVLAGLVGCSGSGSGSDTGSDTAPESAVSTSPVPSASPMESWVDLMCVAELKDAPDPTLHQAPVIAADSLPAAKRRLSQWVNAVSDAATTMVTRLDEIGPPPEGGQDVAAAFDKYRKRYADLADVAGTSNALIDSSPNKGVLDTATQVVQLQLLAATSPLDTDPALRPLIEESLFCR